ncbi:hypothetical protein EMERY_39 [Brevibacillus phage Emery]|nr:hypothetical protein EMERY_39 [Brevibacillus phage Emery]
MFDLLRSSINNIALVLMAIPVAVYLVNVAVDWVSENLEGVF